MMNGYGCFPMIRSGLPGRFGTPRTQRSDLRAWLCGPGAGSWNGKRRQGRVPCSATNLPSGFAASAPRSAARSTMLPKDSHSTTTNPDTEREPPGPSEGSPGVFSCPTRGALADDQSGTRLYFARSDLAVEGVISLSSHGPVFTSKSRPKPTHLPAILRPVGSISS